MSVVGLASAEHPNAACSSEFRPDGGSGTPVPDLYIEVDDIQVAITRFKEANVPIAYGPVSEPWGVWRFYVRDPFGKLINILHHE